MDKDKRNHSTIMDNQSSKQLTIHHWNEAKSLFSDLQTGEWIFRGQQNPNWNLSTSLERFCQEGNKRAGLEEAIVREFRRTAHEYLQSEKAPERYYEWLSLIQHHSASTRLLDWTHSPYVATYFAIKSLLHESGKKEAFSVWAIRKAALRTVNDEECIIGKESFLCRHNEEKSSNDCRCVLIVNPKYSNKRMQLQQAIMLSPTDISISFEENLSSAFDKNGGDTNLIKFIFEGIEDDYIVDSALVDLDYMNINEVTLFPNLDGLAKQINRRSLLKTMFTSNNNRPEGERIRRYTDKVVITVLIKVENKAGTLLEVLKLFKEKKLNIESSYWTPRNSSYYDYWLFALSAESNEIGTPKHSKALEKEVGELSDDSGSQYEATVYPVASKIDTMRSKCAQSREELMCSE